jgi:uncharacterized protein
MMQTLTDSRLERLKTRLRELNRVVIGFSGGIDSTFLLKVTVDTLGGENVWAVTGDSESLLPEELKSCRELVRDIGLAETHFIVAGTEELSNPDYRRNPADRCFYCKTELFGKLKEVAVRVGADCVVDGSNSDDLDDWRPGRRAAADLGVVSPLAESGFGKEDIRELSKELGLPNWDKPALACLSSRIPYGSEVTVEKLNRVARAERYLRSLGFTQLRVRHHDRMARIELLKKEMRHLFGNGYLPEVTAELKSMGFVYVTVDLQGYRSGSMNEDLDEGK